MIDQTKPVIMTYRDRSTVHATFSKLVLLEKAAREN